MPGPSRSGLLASAACGLAGLLACSSGASPVRTCAVADECPATARCISGACVANAPPSAAVALPPAPLRANVLLSFDASATADPDAGDAVASFAWAFRALSAPCAPPAVAGAGPVANVRFACAGRYAVDLTATDAMGAASVRTTEFDVAAYDGPALLTVGPDVVVDHACTPAPMRCAPAGPVSLSASTPGVAAEQVSFAWSVEPPPDRPLEPGRRVALSPSGEVAAPGVTIETDGLAISGDWLFHVEARDAAGVIGAGTMRVSVLNRPPALVESIPLPHHAFDGSQFTAAGEVPFAATDPDGDPLVDRTVEWRHAGDGGSTFSGIVLEAPSRVTFSIAVPYAVPEDASRLIGGAGLSRTIVLGISDVNGARTIESWPIVVGNRPPVLASEPSPFTVDHSYDPIALAYVAEAPLSTWSDPDGDPLLPAAGSVTGDLDCPEIRIEAGIARARCRLPFAGVPAVGNFARAHTVTQTIQDPWEPAAATSSVTFTVANRAPVFTSAATHVVAGLCEETGACCQGPVNECFRFYSTAAPGSATVPGRWSDPDGDPLEVLAEPSGGITPAPLVCTPPACALQLDLAEVAVCGTETTTLATTIGDGLATASAGLTVERRCP